MIDCSQSTMHDILNKPNYSSHIIPKIDAYLDAQRKKGRLAAMAPPIPTPEAVEMGAMFDRLPEDLRQAKILEMRALLAALPPKND